jgi:hypothetical protein
MILANKYTNHLELETKVSKLIENKFYKIKQQYLSLILISPLSFISMNLDVIVLYIYDIMIKSKDISTFLAYIVIALAATFGMYSSAMHIYYVRYPGLLPKLIYAGLHYLKGFIVGGILTEIAIIILALISALINKDSNLKILPFLNNLNKTIFMILKVALRILILHNHIPSADSPPKS